jgi:hypothetical protein
MAAAAHLRTLEHIKVAEDVEHGLLLAGVILV